VTLNDDGMSYASSAKAIRSHWPFADPGTPSAHAVAGLPSKAFTGSNCGRWKSQLPYEDAVTERAPRSSATVWWAMPSVGRIWCGFLPASWAASGALRSSRVYGYEVFAPTSPNRVSARRSPSPTTWSGGEPTPGWLSPVSTVGRPRRSEASGSSASGPPETTAVSATAASPACPGRGVSVGGR
jgi:hypothetical protein